ncbi:MAG: toast rack family protein [Roseiflexaceae bacterium]
MRKPIFLTIIALLLLSACDSAYTPAIRAGAMRTDTISVPAATDTANVTLRFGMADQFRLSGGAEALVDGSVKYNIDELRPTVSTSGSNVTIAQPHDGLIAFPREAYSEWDLRLSNTTPMALAIEAGAYKGAYDLGGLRLRDLRISEGASETTYNFSRPNTEAMGSLAFDSGASNVTLINLANANAAEMSFDGGAGDYTLDFGGELARTATVDVKGGASTYNIRIPAGTPARINLKGGMTTVNVDGFVRQGQQYLNAAWDESKPHLDITVDMGLGTLNLGPR